MTTQRKIRTTTSHAVGAFAMGATTVLGTALGSVSLAPTAAAQPCPDTEVVFARGTGEPAGVGATGQSFVDAVRAQAGPRTVGVYAVNYPAAGDFQDGEQFARTVIDGIRDAANHVETMAANCPNTQMILGGYSQGAAVSGFVTSDAAPSTLSRGLAADVPAPLPAQAADRVAAVVLFGTPSAELLNSYNAPAITIGSRFADKTLQLCNPGDTVCSGAPNGGANVAHALYAVNGSTGQGAAYAVGHLRPAGQAPAVQAPAGTG